MRKILKSLLCLLVICGFVSLVYLMVFVKGATPNYGTVINTWHNKSNYYLRYSDEGQFWIAEVSYASYITCKDGMIWQGKYSEICTKTGG